eukprot:CAMPEP_0174724860 /NCGR_PEP_ID=MMETSP1094-20130205/44303_1 /TAXON_ID=156173 /ORGANISM="Chrysochromulina brevifilum, Strain UTEX LB 985" /LENGTH=107 /DNA_ID=CAMNT_0015926147 /DNA_START=205 /DNA_END=525 /DNA_ORIENTATION=+
MSSPPSQAAGFESSRSSSNSSVPIEIRFGDVCSPPQYKHNRHCGLMSTHVAHETQQPSLPSTHAAACTPSASSSSAPASAAARTAPASHRLVPSCSSRSATAVTVTA